MIKAIEGYPGYFVSDVGTVLSTNRGKCAELKQGTTDKGYKTVTLWDGKKNKFFKVHRLVLFAFAGGPPDKERICAAHLDGSKDNNFFSNLAWVTPRENIAHKRIHGTHAVGSAVNCSKLTEEIVKKSREERAVKGRFWGCNKLAKEYGVSPGTLKRAVLGNESPWGTFRHI